MARSTVKPSAVAIIDADTPAAVTAPVPSAALAVRSAVGIDAVPTFASRDAACAASGKGKAFPVFAVSVIVEGVETLSIPATAASGAAVVSMVRAALDAAGNYGDVLLGAVTYSPNAKGNLARVSPEGERGFRSAVNRAYHAVSLPALGIAAGVVRTGFVAAE